MRILYPAALYISFAVISAASGLLVPAILQLPGEYGYAIGPVIFVFCLVSWEVFKLRQHLARVKYERAGLKLKVSEQKAQIEKLESSLAELGFSGDLLGEDRADRKKLLIAEAKVLKTLMSQVEAFKKELESERSDAADELDKHPPPKERSAEKAERQKPSEQKKDSPKRKPVITKSTSAPEISEVVQNALEESRIDLYLQPTVKLPSRKPVHYECFSRVRTEGGDVILPGEYLAIAERSGLSGTLDNLVLFRCIQLVRRLGPRRPEVRFFLNLSAVALADQTFFGEFMEYMLNHRALAERFVFEMTQSDVEDLDGDIERNLISLGRNGFSFSMDQVTNLNFEPALLAEHFFRYVKIDADKLLEGNGEVRSADLSQWLRRHNLDLIATKIEDEKVVPEILEYDVGFAQGFLFGEPRPSREQA